MSGRNGLQMLSHLVKKLLVVLVFLEFMPIALKID